MEEFIAERRNDFISYDTAAQLLTVAFPVLVASFIMSMLLTINLHVLGLLCLAGMIAWRILRSQPFDSVQA